MEVACPFCRSAMMVRSNAGKMVAAPHLHRWWGECSTCGLLTKTFEAERGLMAYLGRSHAEEKTD